MLLNLFHSQITLIIPALREETKVKIKLDTDEHGLHGFYRLRRVDQDQNLVSHRGHRGHREDPFRADCAGEVQSQIGHG